VTDDAERLIAVLYAVGLRSEGIGPTDEWSPSPPAVYQKRHDMFWSIVAAILEAEPGDYDDLPIYLTECATDQLNDNN
jgi:hypothetical protein